MSQKPFETGDRIQIGETSGDVLDIRFFHFTLMEIGKWVDADQSTGRLVHVPNGKIFTTALHNFNQAMSLIWNEIPILITFESDWQKAKQILSNIEKTVLLPLSVNADKNLSHPYKDLPIAYKNVDPRIYTRIEDSGVLLTVRYLCAPRERRGSEEAAMEAILSAFSKYDNIDFAYPTTRFYTEPGH
jgi:small-conductance mechanosensitive channel